MIGKCDFCEKENIEIFDVDEVFLFFPPERYQHNICEKCIDIVADTSAKEEEEYREVVDEN